MPFSDQDFHLRGNDGQTDRSGIIRGHINMKPRFGCGSMLFVLRILRKRYAYLSYFCLHPLSFFNWFIGLRPFLKLLNELPVSVVLSRDALQLNCRCVSLFTERSLFFWVNFRRKNFKTGRLFIKSFRPPVFNLLLIMRPPLFQAKSVRLCIFYVDKRLYSHF